MEKEPVHSVKLIRESCRGCTNCISRCPTEAIRVTKGKARIITERCIDCGECIRRCPYHAKQADSDSLDDMKLYDYTVAIPAPTLYGQFKREISVNKILTGLKALGFDEVFEAAAAAELVTEYIKTILQIPGIPKPLISSSCPACVRLIQVRYPGLIDHIVRAESPMEIAARIIRKKYPEKKNMGIFFITPCPAKITSVKSPLGNPTSNIDRVIPIKDIFLPLLTKIAEVKNEEILATSGARGISWASRDGESESVGCINSLAVDDIEHVCNFLEKLENGKVKNIDYIEVMACPGGCVGGALTVEDPYIAKMRVEDKVRNTQRIEISEPLPEVNFDWSERIGPRQILKLSNNFTEAMKKMELLEQIEKELPGLDCGACGSPTCRALAEDIVQSRAEKTDCIFILREHIRHLAEEMISIEKRMPPPLDKDNSSNDQFDI